MAIYGKSGGTVKKLEPRVKHNGVIKTPTTGWVKQNGVLKKIWQAFVPITSMSISGPTNINVMTNGWETAQYTCNIQPSDATNKNVTWSWEPVTGFSEDYGDISISSTGLLDITMDPSWRDVLFTITIKATAQDGSGKSAQITVEVYYG